MQFTPNPFRPDKPVDNFDMFAGREDELRILLLSMFNTGHGNARHMIVNGPRGIGKSSFINQIHSVTDNGEEVLERLGVDAGGFRFRFPVFQCRARPGQSAEQIVTTLMDSMPTRLSAGSIRSTVGDFVRRWKPTLSIPGVLTLEHQSQPATHFGREFVRTLSELWSAIERDCDGIIFIIDEVDTVAATSGIASFLKVTTEELVDARLHQVAFYLVGTTGVMRHLMSDHPSIGRVFEPVLLQPMSPEESHDVIKRALESSPASRDVRVPDESLKWVVEIASGYPSVIHRLCYEAFKYDTDQVLDRDDFDKAADEMVSRIKRVELGKLLRTAGAGDYRRILIAMAECKSANVPLSYIGQRIGKTSKQLGKYMSDLVERKTIERTDRGVYRYVEPLLRLYVQKLDVLDPDLSSRSSGEPDD